MREFIYMNGKKSVEIEYIKSDQEGVDEFIDCDVYLDKIKHKFDEGTSYQNKLNFGIEKKRDKYAEFLNNQFENLIVLTGAGSSVGIGKDIQIGEDIKERKGRLLSHLWDDVKEEISEEVLYKFCQLVKYEDKFIEKEGEEEQYVKNLEKLLSLANISKNYVEHNPAEGEDKIEIETIIEKIEEIIKRNCTLKLPDNAPHTLFIEKITKRKVTLPRAKIFTLNYDTLFEQAGRKKNFTIIDGFSFSLPRTFSGRNFELDIVSRNLSRVKEEDNFIQKVFHLYKPHGSIDWTREDNQITQKEEPKKSLMIYPKDSKYESSYEQPYFEMMSRFQQNLRNENTLLICIGFSFNDKHIVTAIIEALEQNPGFQLMVVNKGIDNWSKSFKPIFEASKVHNNIVLIDEVFDEFAKYYPDLKSYNQEDIKKIILNVNN
ncbi:MULTISPECIES: SIR2 family protein [unclassified Flavobacterium]|uniref:SIR2 family protein n=1 Tax=unclassified Flavobacterium TaxID=196869 RepID=UPI000961B313|nr:MULTISPECIES: SIR2 family protein [unclassified Flavobacterium]OJV67797.1 MAG: SIR2 family protein [Flavobacterium sp. 40-81]